MDVSTDTSSPDGTGEAAPADAAPDSTAPAESGADAGTDADSGTLDASPSDSGVSADSNDASDNEASDGGEAGYAGDAGDAGDASDVVESGIPCDAGSSCMGSMACCSSECADLAHDPRNCGSCGNACSSTQFCTSTQCDQAAFSNLCANASVTVVNDAYSGDNGAGAAIGHAIAAACTDAGVAVSIYPQTQPGVLAIGNAGGRPNTGVGTTLIAGGGSFGQLSVQYMDAMGLTPVYLSNNGSTSSIYKRSTGAPLVTTPDNVLDAQHDYFMLELAVEPQSGTLCLFGVGILGPGTVAAGYFGSQVVAPNLASYQAPWYVYEWNDTNNDMTPDDGDTFTLDAQGP